MKHEWLLVVACFLSCTISSSSSRLSSVQLDVPYEQQLTDYSCGDASFSMVAQFYNRTLNQRAIIDVARTSSGEGTFSQDLVRAASFSNMSSAAARHFFPADAPTHGWSSQYHFGLFGSGYRNGTTCWLDGLKDTIAAGFPVIVLQWYSDEPSDGGHYRVVTGYDDEAQLLVTNDPWGRDGQPPVMKYSEQEFCRLWNYTEVPLQ